MKISKSFRTISVVASAALIVGAFAVTPADAKKKKKKKKKPVPSCATFNPVEPVGSNSEQTAEALEAEVVTVTDKATADSPLVIEYEHGPAAWETLTQAPIQEDTSFFNIQIDSASDATSMTLLMEWPGVESDIDMYLYNAFGEEVEVGGAFNTAPVPGILDDSGNGGMGFESIRDFAALDCDGFTIESRAFLTPGEPMTISVWLGA